jgi:predicted Zn finger-like uncharacterized protein
MIIECKCQKRFQIPDDEIIPDGKLLKCSFCGEEWFHNELATNTDLPLPNKNLEKTSKTIIEPSRKPIGFILTLFLIVLFVGMQFNRDLILNKYPNLIGFFESADILEEIVMQNANWVKEILQNLFKQ